MTRPKHNIVFRHVYTTRCEMQQLNIITNTTSLLTQVCSLHKTDLLLSWFPILVPPHIIPSRKIMPPDLKASSSRHKGLIIPGKLSCLRGNRDVNSSSSAVPLCSEQFLMSTSKHFVQETNLNTTLVQCCNLRAPLWSRHDCTCVCP
jgi:hypothetical protein